MSKPCRTPRKKIQQQLRAEVRFGCPVRNPDGTGCGSPILTFHHFDPPWAGHYEHNVDGMIALCPEHHNQADGGRWTRSQLREMKANPFIDDRLKVQWPWTPENIVLKFGGNLVVGGGSPLRLRGRPVFRFNPVNIPGLDISQVSFGSHIRNRSNVPWLSIDDNVFEIDLIDTTDLVFTPQTKMIRASCSDGTELSLRYKRLDRSDYAVEYNRLVSKKLPEEQVFKDLEKQNSVDSDGMVNLVELAGYFCTPDIEIRCRNDNLVVKSLVPGLEEEFPISGYVVNEVNHARFLLQNERNREFLRLG